MDMQRLHEEAYRWEVVVALMQDHGTALTQYCRAWLGEALAEESTLEVFLTAWRMLPQYRPEATLRTWLFGIARHQCQQAYRNRARRQAIVVTFADEIRARTQAEAPPAPGVSLGHEQQLTQLEASLAQFLGRTAC